MSLLHSLKKSSIFRFLYFQRRLQEEILELEFKKKGGHDNGTITERDFADLLIAYAGFSSKKKTKMLKRVRKIYSDDASIGITLKDYLNFYQVHTLHLFIIYTI